MSLFENQLKQREKADNDLFEESFFDVVDSVVGSRLAQTLSDSRIVASNEIDAILKYFHIKTDYDVSKFKNKNINETLEYLLRPHNIMRRTVELEKGWYKNAIGAMLGTRKDDGSVVALIPSKFSGYIFYDNKKREYRKVNAYNEDLFDKEAVVFYKPFPLKKLSIASLVNFIKSNLKISDIVLYAILLGISTGIGYVMPKLNFLLFGDIIAIGQNSALISIAVFMICVSISQILIGCSQSLMLNKITTRINFMTESATFMRVLSLPPNFFRKYSSGELSSRVSYITSLVEQMLNMFLTTTLTSAFSLVYLSQVFQYAPALVVPSVIITIVTVGMSIVTTLMQKKISEQQMELASKERGVSYSILSGVQKIKLAGAEKRAYAKWAKLFSKSSKLRYNPPIFLKLNSVLIMATTLIGNIVLYYFAIRSRVSIAEYYAFNSAYGMISGAFTSLAGIALQIATIQPTLKMIKPILDEEPEISENKKIVEKLNGNIKLDNISFKYSENSPYIFEDFSLDIKAGQYVAIVGKTGCGKSTLVRLLLGFEKPNKGAVYYDGKDINDLDKKSLRSHIGSVMQNGKLMRGDIFSNIVLIAPQLTLDDAWEAAEIAGIADDIKEMPMGMNSFVLEGQGGISGGQKQRLLIARAVAPKPKILILDEATSALDNITQKKVSNALDKLESTRLVIAHRLSTIKQCDRIVVIEDGKIVEDGTYDELMKQNGIFVDLVKRQQVGENI